MEKFAIKLTVGDKINMHCNGWKVVAFVQKTSCGRVNITFVDRTESDLNEGDRVFVV